MEVALDVELAAKDPRSPGTDENRSTKKVKIREDNDPSSEDTIQQVLIDDSMNNADTARPDDEETTTTFPMPGDAHPGTPLCRPASFKDKLLGQGLVETSCSNKNPVDLSIEEGDVEINLEGIIPSITFSGRVKALMSECMRYAVIVKLLGRYIRQDTLQAKIATMWKPAGGFKLTELDGGCYMVKLENEADYQKVMLGGPWVVLGHYLTVHPWEPTLSPSNLEIKQVYGWVRLPGLPYHYYHKSIIRAIGEVIGQVLKIDYNTEGFAKARFARLAVKLDLTKPLVSKINLDGVTQLVEYEGLPTICYSCGRYGHLQEACHLRAQVPISPMSLVTPQPNEHLPPAASANSGKEARGDQPFGEWMMVKPRNRRPPRVPRGDGLNPFHSDDRGGSRFSPLASINNASPDHRGNPRSEIVEQRRPVSAQAELTVTKTKDRKPKSTTNADKPTSTKLSADKTNSPSVGSSSVFASPAFKESFCPTSLGPAHSAVVLLPSSGGDVMDYNQIGPSQTRPTVSARIGKAVGSPKPPDRTKPIKALHLHPKGKFKATKLRPRDTRGVASEQLTQALAEALGKSTESDDDMQFAEATALGFEEDSVSEQSERDH